MACRPWWLMPSWPCPIPFWYDHWQHCCFLLLSISGHTGYFTDHLISKHRCRGYKTGLVLG
eukprot:scaffold552367_cov145-Attheya_sp.AAC.1